MIQLEGLCEAKGLSQNAELRRRCPVTAGQRQCARLEADEEYRSALEIKLGDTDDGRVG